jgi:hypothetical protein
MSEEPLIAGFIILADDGGVMGEKRGWVAGIGHMKSRMTF